jgi:putative ABC transport system substrate-binding protein
MRLRRREFIAGLGGAAAGWPLAAMAQQGERVRRIAACSWGRTKTIPSRSVAFWHSRKRLRAWAGPMAATCGWTFGTGDDINRSRALAHELVGLQPDIILTSSTPATAAVQRETRTIPIIFLGGADPVATGIVARLDRPGGNVTGFAGNEASLAGKWLELLSEIAPGLKRVAIMFNPDTAPVSAHMPSLATAARSLKIMPIITPVHSDVEIETAIMALGREPGGGLVVMSDVFTGAHRAPIISAAARNNIPTVYEFSYFVRDGGLLSYGVDTVDIFRRAATYVDRILRGEKPADLPVQLPTKFEMAVSLKTAKALGLAVPPSILLRADERIE